MGYNIKLLNIEYLNFRQFIHRKTRNMSVCTSRRHKLGEESHCAPSIDWRFRWSEKSLVPLWNPNSVSRISSPLTLYWLSYPVSTLRNFFFPILLKFHRIFPLMRHKKLQNNKIYKYIRFEFSYIVVLSKLQYLKGEIFVSNRLMLATLRVL